MIHRHAPLGIELGDCMATANERNTDNKRQRALDRRALKTMRRIIYKLYGSNGRYEFRRKGCESEAIKWREVINAVRSN